SCSICSSRRNHTPEYRLWASSFFFWSNHGLTRRSHVDLAGAILDRRWALNAPAYRQLAPFGKTVGIPLLLLGGTMAVAGTAWFKRRLWGWRLVVAIIATQVLGDLVNAF